MTGGRRPRPAIEPELEGVFAIDPEVVSAVFDDQVLLHHLNRGETLALDRAMGVILELIDGRRSAAEIRELLQRARPESAAEVLRDVDRTLRCLFANGVLGSPR